MEEAGPAGCDSDKCLLPDSTPNAWLIWGFLGLTQNLYL
jgi:hypothetical protein